MCQYIILKNEVKVKYKKVLTDTGFLKTIRETLLIGAKGSLDFVNLWK